LTPANDNQPPRLLTCKAAAAYVGVTGPTFKKWAGSGLMPPPYRSTKKWDRKAIDAMLDREAGFDGQSGEDAFEKWERGYDARKAAGR